MTHPRELNDAEMMECARNLDDEDASYFGNSNAFYKLYNTAQCAVFYFQNDEPEKSLNTRFEMSIENLCIVGEQEGVDEFTLDLPAGKNGYKILKPIIEGEATSIQMRYEYSLN